MIENFNQMEATHFPDGVGGGNITPADSRDPQGGCSCDEAKVSPKASGCALMP